MAKPIKAEIESAFATATAVEQTIREKIVAALNESGLNVQLKHAENIAARIETIVEQHVEALLRSRTINVGGDDEEAGA